MTLCAANNVLYSIQYMVFRCVCARWCCKIQVIQMFVLACACRYTIYCRYLIVKYGRWFFVSASVNFYYLILQLLLLLHWTRIHSLHRRMLCHCVLYIVQCTCQDRMATKGIVGLWEQLILRIYIIYFTDYKRWDKMRMNSTLTSSFHLFFSSFRFGFVFGFLFSM